MQLLLDKQRFVKVTPNEHILGVFAKFRNANISFVMSVCLSVCLSIRPSVILFFCPSSASPSA
jgi:hypothetical protein